MTRTINVSQGAGAYLPVAAPNGVYILHTNGKIYPRTSWDTSENNNAVGVAVKTTNCSFIIAPEEKNNIQWGSKILINGCTTTTKESVAIKDYGGKSNTDAIVAQLGTNTEYAAKYCRNYAFKNGVQGYLPAAGELYEAYQNKTEVDACIALIGGTPLFDSSVDNFWKWSSTQYDASFMWGVDWSYGSVNTLSKGNVRTRPFASLI